MIYRLYIAEIPIVSSVAPCRDPITQITAASYRDPRGSSGSFKISGTHVPHNETRTLLDLHHHVDPRCDIFYPTRGPTRGPTTRPQDVAPCRDIGINYRILQNPHGPHKRSFYQIPQPDTFNFYFPTQDPSHFL